VLPTHVTQTSAKTQAAHRGNDDGGCCPNVGDLQGILDPLVLALMLGICLSAIAVGFYQLFVTGEWPRYCCLPASACCCAVLCCAVL
jgi:hypothetical protein